MLLVNSTIDDRAVKTIHFAGSWNHGASYNVGGQSGTLSYADDLNANFTYDTPPIYAFYYFGIKGNPGGFYQICVDCDLDNPQWQDIDALDPTSTGQELPVALFSMQWDDPQPHEVIVTNRPDSRIADNRSQLTLDELVLTVASTSGVPTQPSNTATSTPSPAHKSDGILVAAVVSSIVGSVLITLLAVFLMLRHLRKKAANAPRNGGAVETQMAQVPMQSPVPGDIDPFHSPLHEPAGLVFAPPPLPRDRKGQPPAPSQPLHQTSGSISSSNGPFRDSLNGQSSSSHFGSPIESPPIREEDGGSIHGMSERRGAGTLPPDYHNATQNRK